MNSRRRWLTSLGVTIAGLTASSVGARAQESSPRFTIAGSGLVSFNLNFETRLVGGQSDETDFGTVNDFSDSFVLMRVDQQLYDKNRAGVIVGFLFPDAKSDLGQVFYNQVQVFYNSRRFAGRLGRTRLSNFLLEFPTLREEDLLEYAFVTNSFANTTSSELSRYGNVLRGELYQFNSRFVLAAQVTNWAVTDAVGSQVDDFEVNGLSASVMYRLPEPLRFSGVVRAAGVSLQSQNVEAVGQDWMHTVSAGVALNLTRHPLRNVEFRAQGIYNFGVSDLETRDPVLGSLASFRGRGRSEYVALVGSLRFLSRPYQLDRFQAAVTAAYKTFPDRDGSQFTLIPNVFFRLGQGVDLGLQYQFARFDGTLAQLMGMRREQSLKFTFSFRFQAMFNNYFGERDDILNLEHGYIR